MKLQLIFILMIIILISIVKSVSSIKQLQSQFKNELINGFEDGDIHFSILPFDRAVNEECKTGGYFGLGLTGKINSCVIDPDNDEYNYKITLKDIGNDHENIFFQLFNKSNTECEGPLEEPFFFAIEGYCTGTTNFIQLKDTLSSGGGIDNQHFLSDQLAYPVVSDMPFFAPDSIIFGTFNNSYCSEGIYSYPIFSKSYSEGLYLTKSTDKNSTYSYTCNNTANIPQIKNCLNSNCKITDLDNSCSLVPGTNNIYQQIFCGGSMQ